MGRVVGETVAVAVVVVVVVVVVGVVIVIVRVALAEIADAVGDVDVWAIAIDVVVHHD